MKTNIHHLLNMLNTVRKFNDIKLTFWFLITTGSFYVTRIMRLLNY